MEMKGKTIWRGSLLLILLMCMSMSAQAAYLACSEPLENPIHLSKVTEQRMITGTYRLASESNASGSNADILYVSSSNATASNAGESHASMP